MSSANLYKSEASCRFSSALNRRRAPSSCPFCRFQMGPFPYKSALRALAHGMHARLTKAGRAWRSQTLWRRWIRFSYKGLFPGGRSPGAGSGQLSRRRRPGKSFPFRHRASPNRKAAGERFRQEGDPAVCRRQGWGCEGTNLSASCAACGNGPPRGQIKPPAQPLIMTPPA